MQTCKVLTGGVSSWQVCTQQLVRTCRCCRFIQACGLKELFKSIAVAYYGLLVTRTPETTLIVFTLNQSIIRLVGRHGCPSGEPPHVPGTASSQLSVSSDALDVEACVKVATFRVQRLNFAISALDSAYYLPSLPRATSRTYHGPTFCYPVCSCVSHSA